MAHKIHIPKLSMTMAEARLVEWKAEEGEWVEKGQALLVIETDKVTAEVESPAAGFLIILARAARVIPVGEVVGLLAETEEELQKLQKGRPPGAERVEEKQDVMVSAEVRALQEAGEKVKASPVAKAMAKEFGLDLNRIVGSGPGGRIVREDVEAALKVKKEEVAPSEEIHDGKKVKITIPLAGMRKVIAEHMHRSLLVSAQLTNSGQVDMTEITRLRNRLLDGEKILGLRVTYTDLFVFFLARALKDHPIINSSLIGNEIKIWEDINIGVAVAIELNQYESGLVVPVVKNADRKSLIKISKSIRDLVEKARNRKLMPDDLSDGTFTLTNHGVFDIGESWTTPIINQPQSAIMGTGGIVEKPVVKDGQISIRPVMNFTLTYDHRVIDGAPSFRFMARVKELMENPDLLLVGEE